MPKKKPTTRKPKLAPTVLDAAGDEAKAAELFDGNILALRLHLAAGAIPTGDYQRYLEAVTSLAAVGQIFDVSERTIASWKAKGMPVGDDGTYHPAEIRYWRLLQPDPPDWLFQGNKALPPRSASGDLARAILRVLRADLIEAGRRARADFLSLLDLSSKENIGDAFAAAMARHFEPFRLSDDEIEKLLELSWGLA